MQHKANQNFEPAFVEDQHRRMADSLTRAIRQEVARRRREGLPIHVCENGNVIDLQEVQSESHDD